MGGPLRLKTSSVLCFRFISSMPISMVTLNFEDAADLDDLKIFHRFPSVLILALYSSEINLT